MIRPRFLSGGHRKGVGREANTSPVDFDLGLRINSKDEPCCRYQSLYLPLVKFYC